MIESGAGKGSGVERIEQESREQDQRPFVVMSLLAVAVLFLAAWFALFLTFNKPSSPETGSDRIEVIERSSDRTRRLIIYRDRETGREYLYIAGASGSGVVELLPEKSEGDGC